jgi:hypothetical protein
VWGHIAEKKLGGPTNAETMAGDARQAMSYPDWVADEKELALGE